MLNYRLDGRVMYCGPPSRAADWFEVFLQHSHQSDCCFANSEYTQKELY